MAFSKSLAAFAVAMAVAITATSAQNTPQDFVNLHNRARAVERVGPVTWDPKVAKFAQDYAAKRAGDCRLQHSGGPFGENIFWGSAGRAWSAADALKSWVDEKKNYHLDTNTCDPGKVCAETGPSQAAASSGSSGDTGGSTGGTSNGSGGERIEATSWLDQVGVQQPLEACPMPWLGEYEAFHAANRGKPGAKYLVHAVDSRMSGGLGDRLRGMLYTLRAAVATKRVILFRWTHPHPLRHFFEPGGAIDWRTDGLDLPEGGPVISAIDGPVEQVVNGSLLHATDAVITIKTNRYMDATCLGCPQLSLWGTDTPCLWTRVFKPAAAVQRRAQQQLRELFNASRPRYTAIHMRLGGMAGEPHIPFVRGGGAPFDNFLKAAQCAQRLAKRNALQLPVLMVVDSNEVRDALKDHNFPGIVSPTGRPVHLDRADGSSVEDHQTAVLDLALLARSQCLVTSPSGFSHHSWLAGGGKKCQRMFFDCANTEGGPGGGPDDQLMTRGHDRR